MRGAGRLSPWAALLAAVLLLYGVNLIFPRDLWVQDEARYGEAVREMVASGRYLVPTLDGQFYPDKPPLYFWLLAAQARLTGLGMLSFRLITLAQMLGFAAAFFVLARRLLGESRGLWAVIICLTTQLYLIAGNIVRMDVLLAAFVVLSLHFLLRAVEEGRRGLALAGYLFAVVATMVKGPLGFAFPVGAALLYALLRQRLRGLARLRLGLGVVLPVAVGAAWTGYLFASHEGAYIREVLVKQLWGRSVQSWSHPQPPYFYALVLLPLLMPWLPFLRRGLARATGPVRLRRPGEEVRCVALCWFLPGFALISALSGKLFVYLVPLFPPLALLAAASLPAPWEAWEEPPHVAGAGLAAGLFFAAAGAGLLWGLARYLPADLAWRLLPAAGLLVGLGGLLILLRRRARALLWALLAGACLVSWVGLGFGAAQLNDYFSPRALGERLAALSRAGWQIAAVDIARGTLSFYAGGQLRQLSAAQLEAALREPGRLAVAVREKKKGLIPPGAFGRLTLDSRFPRLEFAGYAIYLELPEAPSPTSPTPVAPAGRAAVQ